MARDARARRAESREKQALENRKRSGRYAAPSKPVSAGAKVSEPSVGGSVGQKRRTRGSAQLEELEPPSVPARRSRSAMHRTVDKTMATRANAAPYKVETSAKRGQKGSSSATTSPHGGSSRKRPRTVDGTPEKPVCPDSEQSEAESAATHPGSLVALDQSLLPSTSAESAGEGEGGVQAPAGDEGESRRGCFASRAACSQLSSPSWSALWSLRDRLSNAQSGGGLSLALRPALERVQRQLEQQLENTVSLGHSCSLLVVGPPQSGKTLVVERAVHLLCSRTNTSTADPAVGVVRLASWAHGEDGQAFRQISRQLCDVFGGSFRRAASVSDNIEFLRDILTALASAQRSVVFVLDEFDGFARRSKQTLLYNLLDALQASRVRAAVVGVTARVDCVELLEKRVRSRFSHRLLSVGGWGAEEEAGGEGGSASSAPSDREMKAPQDPVLSILRACLELPQAGTAAQKAFAIAFNGAWSGACRGAQVLRLARRAVQSVGGLGGLANVAQAVLDELVAGRQASGGDGGASAEVPLVTRGLLLRALQKQVHGTCATMMHAVSQLSVLEQIVLVAAHRAQQKSKDNINFEIVHHQLQTYVSRSNHVDSYTRAAVWRAYDSLVEGGMLSYLDARIERFVGLRQHACVAVQVAPWELSEGLEVSAHCPSHLYQWATKEGVQLESSAFVV